jgi:nucleoside-diphosphate-sugar epimerase
MRILFTGASSFTGCWFVRALAEAGHQVTALFRQSPDAYPDPLRRERAMQLQSVSMALVGASFGDPAFRARLREGGFELLCHHAAEVGDYRSPAFDVASALAANTRDVRACLADFAANGGRAVLLTGSIFERGEGLGDAPTSAVSPYGLSKSLTSEVFAFEAPHAGLAFGKFVIPNPFGPFEEARFTAHLLSRWHAGERVVVRTPDYVRDNIHVDLLARAYVRFAESLPAAAEPRRLGPSGYVESQGAFAERFAREMRARLGLACALEHAVQTDWSEPRVRINSDACDAKRLGWDEARAWDAIAAYYAGRARLGAGQPA